MNNNILLKDCLMNFMKERNFVDESVVEGRYFFVKEGDLTEKRKVEAEKHIQFLGYSFSVESFKIAGLNNFDNYTVSMNNKKCFDIQINTLKNEGYIIREYEDFAILEMFLENIKYYDGTSFTPADILSMVLMKKEIMTENPKEGHYIWIWGIGELDEYNRALTSEEFNYNPSELQPKHHSLLKFLADYEFYEEIQSGNRHDYMVSLDYRDLDLAVIIAHCSHVVVGDKKGYNSLFYLI